MMTVCSFIPPFLVVPLGRRVRAAAERAAEQDAQLLLYQLEQGKVDVPSWLTPDVANAAVRDGRCGSACAASLLAVRG